MKDTDDPTGGGNGADRLPEPLDGALGAALAALPDTRQPGEMLEERTVRRLRAAGVLGRPGSRRRESRRRREWLAAGVAASVALFAMGVATGQWLSARQTAGMLAAHQQASLQEMSALVQQTGTAYVSALARLAEAGPAGTDSGSAGVRDAAVEVLHLAANEVARLAPNDPVTARILQAFDHAALQQVPDEGRERRRQIVWF